MPALRCLTQVELLKSKVVGRDSGFIFARDPALISIYEVVTALEGEFKLSSCRDVVDDGRLLPIFSNLHLGLGRKYYPKFCRPTCSKRSNHVAAPLPIVCPLKIFYA